MLNGKYVIFIYSFNIAVIYIYFKGTVLRVPCVWIMNIAHLNEEQMENFSVYECILA